MAKSIPKACLRFTGLFEAELLTELMLRFWNHPRANDPSFRSALLETAAEVLKASAEGECLFQDLDAANVNFVAAMWYAESISLLQQRDIEESERQKRNVWLDSLVKALPSCFCNPNRL